MQNGGFMTLRKFERVLSDIKGFTLAEMMAAAGVFAVLAVVAVPNYLAFQPNMRLNGASREVLGKLMWARSKAKRTIPRLPSAKAVMIRPSIPEEPLGALRP